MMMAPRIRQRRRRVVSFALLATGCVLLGTFSLAGEVYRPARARIPAAEADRQTSSIFDGQCLMDALHQAASQVKPLKAQVDAGSVVPQFGDKAEEILNGIRHPDIRLAVEGTLHALFLQQIALLRRHVAETFDGAGRDVDAISQADRQFVLEAEALLCRGSAWSFEIERQVLRGWLEGAYRRDASLAEEQAKAAQTQQARGRPQQQATINVIAKLQSQMEMLQQKAQSVHAGGSPWVLSSSYRIPNTPLQVVGKYERGRAHVALNLTPAKDPANSEAGFVESLGPANLGVSFNVGL